MRNDGNNNFTCEICVDIVNSAFSIGNANLFSQSIARFVFVFLLLVYCVLTSLGKTVNLSGHFQNQFISALFINIHVIQLFGCIVLVN